MTGLTVNESKRENRYREIDDGNEENRIALRHSIDQSYRTIKAQIKTTLCCLLFPSKHKEKLAALID